MATSGGDGPHWPSPVTINDEDPKGFLTIFLSLPKLKISRSMGLFGKAEAKNADPKIDFKAESVSAEATVTDKEGKKVSYKYEKTLPEDINPSKCGWKVKEGQLILSLAKSEPGSWAQHSKHFIKKE